jgi:hypothetical protein
MRGAALVAIGITAAACAASCATATGDVSGGDPRFAEDAGGDAPTSFPEDDIDAGAGTTWTDLYRDLFGPTGGGSCAGNGTCHGAADQAGTKSVGFLCADQDGCRASLFATSLVRALDAQKPDDSGLIGVMRHRSPSGAIVGLMPRAPGTYVFSHDSIARVRAWIAAGAPNDAPDGGPDDGGSSSDGSPSDAGTDGD